MDGVGISVGVVIGAAMGPLFENIGIGIAIGSGIGASLEQKNKDSIRPLTEQDQVRQKRGVIAGLIVMFLALVSILILFLQGK